MKSITHCSLALNKMLCRSVALCLFAASVFPKSLSDATKGYHKLVGIPAAERIKAREDAILLESNSRISKSHAVDIEKYPYFAGLLIGFKNYQGASFCGGTLVSSSRVLTAAHCWTPVDVPHPPDFLIVVLGSEFLTKGGLRVVSREVFQHPQFDEKENDNDIAVIYLPNRINFTSTIFPIALPKGDEMVISYEDYTATAIGMGAIDDGKYIPTKQTLRAVHLKIFPDDACRTFMGRGGFICTSGEDGQGPCGGDSGGPLITYTPTNKVLIGVIVGGVRWTYCGAGTRVVHARIITFIDFIESHVIRPNFTFTYKTQEGLRYEFITVTDGAQTIDRLILAENDYNVTITT